MTTEAEYKQIEQEFEEWIECWQCDGIGMTPSCFEDCCSGVDCYPDDAELCCNPHTCDICHGNGGWHPAERSANEVSTGVDHMPTKSTG